MKNETKGVDPTASLASSTITIENTTENPSSVPAVHPFARPENVGIISQVTNSVVTPNLQVLLASVLGTIDASIPNKDQNRAVKHIVRKQFDTVYEDILRRCYPDCGFEFNSDYSLHPEPNKDKAFSSTL